MGKGNLGKEEGRNTVTKQDKIPGKVIPGISQEMKVEGGKVPRTVIQD